MFLQVVSIISLLSVGNRVVSVEMHHQQYENSASIPQSNQTNINNERRAEGRFGFPVAYGNDLQGYSGGAYAPVKIELGGLFLGTIIGLGAVLLIPKLSHVFSSHHSGHAGGGGGYFRNLPDTQSMFEGFSQAIARFEESLREHHIDSVSCLERAACSYAKSSNNSNDSILQSKNSIMKFALEGTKLKAALDRGSVGGDCSSAYPSCNFSKHLIMNSIKSVIMDNKL